MDCAVHITHKDCAVHITHKDCVVHIIHTDCAVLTLMRLGEKIRISIGSNFEDFTNVAGEAYTIPVMLTVSSTIISMGLLLD